MSIRNVMLLGILGVAGSGAAAAAELPAGAPADVRVRVSTGCTLAARELQLATAEADRLLAVAGVKLALEPDGAVPAHEALVAAYETSFAPPVAAPRAIEVRVAHCGQPGVPPCRPGVLGSTVKDGDGSRVRYIALYADRIRAAARDGLVPRATLLGRVLAHEIVHALAGGGAHEERGLMRCHWSMAAIDGPLDARAALSPALRERVRLAAAVARR